MVDLLRRADGLIIRNAGGLLARATSATQVVFDECCCEEDCCIGDLSSTICATVLTNDCGSSSGGTVTIELTSVYSVGLVRVWQGSGSHCPTSCETWYLQLHAECDEAGSGVTWNLCHDSCTDGGYHCPIDPPNIIADDWTEIGSTDGTPCLYPGTYTGVPLSSCGDSGAYDCSFVLSFAEGAC